MSIERGPINVVLRGEQSGRQISVIDAVIDTVVDAGLLGLPLHHHDFEVFSREGRASAVFATCTLKASLRPPDAHKRIERKHRANRGTWSEGVTVTVTVPRPEVMINASIQGEQIWMIGVGKQKGSPRSGRPPSSGATPPSSKVS